MDQEMPREQDQMPEPKRTPSAAPETGSNAQGELSFGNGSDAGLKQWLENRRRATEQLARELGLPLRHLVEVRLKDGVVLRGVLRLREELLFLDGPVKADLELEVNRVNFLCSEIEACVRQD